MIPFCFDTSPSILDEGFPCGLRWTRILSWTNSARSCISSRCRQIPQSGPASVPWELATPVTPICWGDASSTGGHSRPRVMASACTFRSSDSRSSCARDRRTRSAPASGLAHERHSGCAECRGRAAGGAGCPGAFVWGFGYHRPRSGAFQPFTIYQSAAAARGSDHENLPGPRCPRDRLTLDSQSVAIRQRSAKSANKRRGEAVNPVRS